MPDDRPGVSRVRAGRRRLRLYGLAAYERDAAAGSAASFELINLCVWQAFRLGKVQW